MKIVPRDLGESLFKVFIADAPSTIYWEAPSEPISVMFDLNKRGRPRKCLRNFPFSACSFPYFLLEKHQRSLQTCQIVSSFCFLRFFLNLKKLLRDRVPDTHDPPPSSKSVRNDPPPLCFGSMSLKKDQSMAIFETDERGFRNFSISKLGLLQLSIKCRIKTCFLQFIVRFQPEDTHSMIRLFF